jgi:hypothetical protein
LLLLFSSEHLVPIADSTQRFRTVIGVMPPGVHFPYADT